MKRMRFAVKLLKHQWISSPDEDIDRPIGNSSVKKFIYYTCNVECKLFLQSSSVPSNCCLRSILGWGPKWGTRSNPKPWWKVWSPPSWSCTSSFQYSVLRGLGTSPFLNLQCLGLHTVCLHVYSMKIIIIDSLQLHCLPLTRRDQMICHSSWKKRRALLKASKAFKKIRSRSNAQRLPTKKQRKQSWREPRKRQRLLHTQASEPRGPSKTTCSRNWCAHHPQSCQVDGIVWDGCHGPHFFFQEINQLF